MEAVTVQPPQIEAIEPAEGIDWSKVERDKILAPSPSHQAPKATRRCGAWTRRTA